jgi:hypothetical protein
MNEVIQLFIAPSLEPGVIVRIRFQHLNPIKSTHSDLQRQALEKSML